MSENQSGLLLLGASLFLLVLLTFAVLASGDDLDGSSWSLDRLVVEGNEEAVIEGTDPTISFAGGEVDGYGGCNSFFGTYEVDGTSFSVGPLGSTQRFCDDPAGTSDQEAAFLSQLGAATTFRIDGGQLILSDSSTDLLVFRSR